MNRKSQRYLAGIAAVGVLASAVSSIMSPALLAQSSSGPVCMAKAPTSAVPLTVMVTPTRQSELGTAGFSVQTCAGKETAIAQYRSDICALASGMPQAAQQQFTQAYGIAPARLCQLAGEL